MSNSMPLNLNIIVPPALTHEVDMAKVTEAKPEQRAALIKWFQRELARPDQPLVVTLEGDRTLRVELYRQGRAAAAIWSAQSEGIWENVAVSALLLGENGENDVAAVDTLRHSHLPLPFEAAQFNAVLASERPCICIIYAKVEWLQDAKLVLQPCRLRWRI